jgi:hypothetical protein
MFRPDNPKHPGFEGLDQDIFPIFPIERSIQINGFSIRRKQVPMCPAFSLTDYKVQSKTLSKVIVDIKDDGDTRGQDSHRKFCSRYVQLSRPTSWDDLHLLRRIEAKDIAFRPHPDLIAEMEKFQELERKTMSSWTE